MPDRPRARAPSSFFHEELATVDLLSDQTPTDDQSLHTVALRTAETIEARTHARILLVEDDVVLADAFSSLLSSSGHEVVVAHATNTAELMLSCNPFDVIISDILLPGDSGLALARNVRAKDRQQPIILAHFVSC
jgi:PleD family two-component response regulator